jgi:transposase-like protein
MAKKAKVAARRKKGDTGKRYSVEDKKKIMDFVASQGRGGISKACKKFKVSYIALRRWLQSAGIQAGNSSAASAEKSNKRMAVGLKKATEEVKQIRKQVTALHRLLRALA